MQIGATSGREAWVIGRECASKPVVRALEGLELISRVWSSGFDEALDGARPRACVAILVCSGDNDDAALEQIGRASCRERV